MGRYAPRTGHFSLRGIAVSFHLIIFSTMVERLFYSIAGHTVCIEGPEECSLLLSIPGFHPFALPQDSETSGAEFRVVFGCDVPMPPSWEELYNFDFDFLTMYCSFARVRGHAPDGDGPNDKATAYYFSMGFHDCSHPSMLMRYEGGNTIYASHASEVNMLRYALWSALTLFLAPAGATLIHSSTIVANGQAVLFLGESGTGKSTHTHLWLQNIPKCKLLNDDSPIISVGEGVPVVYGSPWSGKTHCYHPEHFPLAAVVRLSQAPYNKIRRLPVVQAFASLQPSCPPLLSQDDHFSDCLASMLSRVIQEVPVFHLECLPDAAAAQCSFSAIFG